MTPDPDTLSLLVSPSTGVGVMIYSCSVDDMRQVMATISMSCDTTAAGFDARGLAQRGAAASPAQ